ncbi:uncharacterized protein LOC129248413 isoform X2 [Anastrepha obliqua]|uniref:uncharacterized protein LOC129248021 isoform X2 n=1 Tax=Anastrepha obliqua TaxID=95512 RepID=UPI0024090655|nr:uncharacterized protein LOC129248021 isoform X2 [Anastrepha obliqua]XP_054743929.1 uncharacterized protein LOC129248413 isoform X2 [Anastrepha obliqua]
MKGMKKSFVTKASQKEMFCDSDKVNNQLKAKCAKLELENEELTKFLQELRADISQLKTDVSTIKNSTATQGVILEKLVQKVLPKTSNLTILPFKTIEEIKSADNILSQYPRDELVAYVRNTVGVTPIRKIVPFLFAESTMPFINWDGRHQRFAIKSLQFFNEIVFRAVQGPDMDFSKFDSEMRKGIRSAKNKMYKNKSNQS